MRGPTENTEFPQLNQFGRQENAGRHCCTVQADGRGFDEISLRKEAFREEND